MMDKMESMKIRNMGSMIESIMVKMGLESMMGILFQLVIIHYFQGSRFRYKVQGSMIIDKMESMMIHKIESMMIHKMESMMIGKMESMMIGKMGSMMDKMSLESMMGILFQ